MSDSSVSPLVAGDAAIHLTDSAHLATSSRPDVVIVNPPRRGIGTELASELEGSGIETVVYSSCNPTTLAKDLDRMPSYSVSAARILDMLSHTEHMECSVLLERDSILR